jgi:hypothetical protein
MKIENGVVFIGNKPCYLPIAMLNNKKHPKVCKACAVVCLCYRILKT